MQKPDECFYIRRIGAVQGKQRLDLAEDPAPDLVVEIDVTSSSQNRLQVYADLGVTEVWVYNGASLVIHQLQNDAYVSSKTSQFFPNIPIPDYCRLSSTSDKVRLSQIGDPFSDLGETSDDSIKSNNNTLT